MSLSIPISVLPVSPMYDVFRTSSLLEPLMKNYMMSMSNDPEREREIESLQGSENEFRVNLDVQQFHPDQLSVKVVDNSVIINGKHEERQDEHGYISREFTRRYVLPDTVDPAQVISSLSSDGVLTISAPKKVPEIEQNERVVPIVKTN